VIFAVAVIDGFFPPIPSEAVLVVAAAVAASAGDFATRLLLCVVAAAGAGIGDNIAYAIGRGVGTTRFRWMRGPAWQPRSPCRACAPAPRRAPHPRRAGTSP
jgi:membrane protein DedA with SNARE-associated domain